LLRAIGSCYAKIGAVSQARQTLDGVAICVMLLLYGGLAHTNASRMSVFIDLTPLTAQRNASVADLCGVIAAVFWASTTVVIRATRLSRATRQKRFSTSSQYRRVVNITAVVVAVSACSPAWCSCRSRSAPRSSSPRSWSPPGSS